MSFGYCRVVRLFGYAKVVFSARLFLLAIAISLSGCVQFPPVDRFTVRHSRVEDNLLGPFFSISVLSPTSLKVSYMDDGVEYEKILELRGVKPPDEQRAIKQAMRWLQRYDRESRIGNRHFYILRDTLVSSEDRLSGVVLVQQQGSVFIDLTSGERTYKPFLYAILQSVGLSQGHLLHDASQKNWEWHKNFAHFEEGARGEKRGYWALEKASPIESDIPAKSGEDPAAGTD
jgi:hypothetical protein